MQKLSRYKKATMRPTLATTSYFATLRKQDFEKNMYNRLKSYIEDNELLYKAQYGFREKFSSMQFWTYEYDTNKYGQENVHMWHFS